MFSSGFRFSSPCPWFYFAAESSLPMLSHFDLGSWEAVWSVVRLDSLSSVSFYRKNLGSFVNEKASGWWVSWRCFGASWFCISSLFVLIRRSFLILGSSLWVSSSFSIAFAVLGSWCRRGLETAVWLLELLLEAERGHSWSPHGFW